VQRVTDIIGEISAAATEQSGGIEQVNHAVTEIERMTQQNAALVEQSAAAAGSMNEQAGRLSQAVATFRLQANESARPARASAASSGPAPVRTATAAKPAVRATPATGPKPPKSVAAPATAKSGGESEWASF